MIQANSATLTSPMKLPIGNYNNKEISLYSYTILFKNTEEKLDFLEGINQYVMDLEKRYSNV